MRIAYCLLILLLTSTATFAQLTSIQAAKTFFSSQANSNILLISTSDSGDNTLFTFEGNQNNQQIAKSIISSISPDPANWKTSITYTDSTVQEVPTLGSSLDISDKDVINSPYSQCPLTAVISFNTKVPGKVHLKIVGRDANSQDLDYQSERVGTRHVLNVIGLYADFLNTVVITFMSPTGVERGNKTLTIKTAAHPNAERVQVEIVKNDRPGHFFYFMGATLYDEQGYLRWYAVGLNNLFPLSDNKFAFLIPRTTVGIFDLTGRRFKTFTIPSGLHHEIREKTPGGNLLILSHNQPEQDSEDLIIEVDRSTGQVVKQWDMLQYFDRNRPRNWLSIIDIKKPEDWIHLNSVRYDPSDNTLLLSGRHQNLVAKIGYDDGTVKWMICNHENWTAPHTNYLLTPTNFNTSLHADQDWTYLQHDAQFLDNGDILIYDNGGTRPGFTNDDTYNPALPQFFRNRYIYSGWNMPPGYVRAVQYRVDPNAMTITKVMEYTDYPEYPTSIVGSVTPLEQDVLMIGHGELGQMLISNTVNKTNLFKAQRPSQFYRSFPVSISPTDGIVCTIPNCDKCLPDAMCTKCFPTYGLFDDGARCACESGKVDTGSRCEPEKKPDEPNIPVIESGGLSGGAIAGIVIGSIIIVGAVGLAVAKFSTGKSLLELLRIKKPMQKLSAAKPQAHYQQNIEINQASSI